MKKLASLLLALLLASPALRGQAFKETRTLLNAVATTGQSTAFNVEVTAPSNHTLAVTVTGAPATCTIALMGAATTGTPVAADWFNLSGNQSCTAKVMFHTPDRPMLWVAADLSALSGGTSPTVTAKYVGTR